MARRRKTITCVLCNRSGESSDEDVVAKWLGRAIAAHGTPPYFDLTVEMDDGKESSTSERRIGGLPLPWKLPEVCQHCNNGWMSNLEQTMQRAGKRLIDGKPHFLHPWEQVVIATWMTKTALLYDVARGNQMIPLADGCHPFYLTGQPLPRSQVMIAAFQPPDRGVVIPHRRKEHKLIDLTTGDIAYHAVDISFVFGSLFIQVYINHRDDARNFFGYPGGHPDLVQCWPVRHPISWEPPVRTPAPPEAEADPKATEA